MSNRPPSRYTSRPKFARNVQDRRSSAASVDNVIDGMEGPHTRALRGRGAGVGPNRGGAGRGRWNPGLRHQLSSSVGNLNFTPNSTRTPNSASRHESHRQNHWEAGRNLGDWQVAPGRKGSGKRGGNSGYQRGSQSHISGANRQSSHSQGQGPLAEGTSPMHSYRMGRKKPIDPTITKLETLSDWTNLSNLGNSFRILTKLQNLESSWIKAFHADAPFEVLDLAFQIFSDIDLKYRYAKVALMKSLFTNKFIERLAQIVDTLKTTWLQVGLGKVQTFVEKLRKNMEFVLSSVAGFHENESSNAAVGGLIDGCVGTLDHINNFLKSHQGSTNADFENEIAEVRKLSEIQFVENVILDESPYPDDFRSPFDVMPNIVHGPYQGNDHYILTHFSLLKEDFQSVLRAGVEQYLADPRKRNFDIWSYENVLVKRFFPPKEYYEQRKIDNRKLLFKVTFPGRQQYFSKIQWKFVKRFMFGSLIVLTTDEFNSYYLALIEERFFDNPGAISIVLSFIYAPPNGVEDTKFLLVEPKPFYEPYLNSMKVLKHMAKIGIPLKKYIVNADTETVMPAYLNSESVYEIGSHEIELSNILSWPSAEDLGLNQSQKQAFINALTSEMALIQGPPGTGKTFLAFKIIQTLLNNRENFMSLLSIDKPADGPIMIVCYKNHSLDQILTGLLQKNRRVIRIGGGSKFKALQFDHNYKRLPTPHTISSVVREQRELRAKLSSCLVDIKNTVSLINLIKAKIGVLKVDILKRFEIVPDDFHLRLEKWLLEIEEAPQLAFDYIQQQGGAIVNNLNSYQKMILSRDFQLDLLSIGNEIIKCEHTLCVIEADGQEHHSEAMMIQFWKTNKHYKDVHARYCSLHCGLNLALNPSDFPDVILSNAHGYSHLDLEERWALYRKWESELVEQLENKVLDLQNQVPEMEENLSEYDEMVMSHTLKFENPQVIGVTTSGASKHYSALADVGPKIVLVEEAAEVLEAHVLASLSTKCQHLILIGDHQQLKPSTASHRIGTRYRMDVSLFERMIKNNMKVSCLATQHRMRPEIAALICPSIYENLENHPAVQEYPAVKGTKKNVYFFNHDHLEQVGFDSESKFNPEEGEMLTSVAHYLIQQGYSPSEITILSTYLEQDRFIKKNIEQKYRDTGLKDVFCTVVDNYQGEENVIILLSLVRGNPVGDIGFLSTKNRVCVALSRAKHGLFIFGNMSCLTMNDSEIWGDVNKVLVSQDAIGAKFPLQCIKHCNITEVASPEDLAALEYGGCSNLCDAPLPCGHTCKIMCHGLDMEHTGKFHCRQQCMKSCRNGHTCQAPCHSSCPPCPVMMTKRLVCGHSKQLECHKANLQAYCTEIVEIKLERCSHNQLVLCTLTEQSERHKIVCKSDCKHTFNCGHVCKSTCHVSEDPDHKIEFLCEEPCELINKSCPRKHRCNKKCREPCGDCLVVVEKSLPCGHKAEMKCCQDVQDFMCTEQCSRKLPCGHDCANQCIKPCGPCKILVEKVIAECGHKMNFKCSDVATRSHCKQPCQTIRSCGHSCTGICKQICEEIPCGTKVKVELPCGHEASLPCSEVLTNRFTNKCRTPCQAKLPCGHRCKGTCGSCLQGSVHVPCDEICDNTLLCNHKCRIRCCDSYHSCTNYKCFKTCWQNEMKCQPSSFKRGRGKRNRGEFNPKVHFISQLRRALGEENEKMWEMAGNYNANKRVAYQVKQIQLYANKSRNTKNDEELPTLKTSVFKVEFVSAVSRIMERLQTTKLAAAKKSEMEHLLETLVARSASSRLIGTYEMTQLQEQIVWASLLLDIHGLTKLKGNDRNTTDQMLSLLAKTKSSFGPDERAEINRKFRDFTEKMGITNFVLTDVELKGLFPAADRYCAPICHHRLVRGPGCDGHTMGEKEQNKQVNVNGANDSKNVTATDSGGLENEPESQ